MLSIAAGSGHTQAASALAEGLRSLGDWDCHIADAFREFNPLLDRAVVGTYLEVLKHTPKVFGFLYRQAASESLAPGAKRELMRLLRRLTAPKLTQRLAEIAPRVVICTHPFPLGIMSVLKERGEFRSSLVAAMTDHAAHPFWTFPGVDLYLWPNHEVAQYLGPAIGGARAAVTGIPIAPAFERAREPLATYDALVMGGGLGLGRLVELVDHLVERVGASVAVVTGRNEELRSKLSRSAGRYPAGRVGVFGFTLEIPRLMASARLLLTKAGGLTTAEALALGLPMILVQPLPGPEQENADYLVRLGAGVRADDPLEAAVVARYLLNSPKDLEAMGARALVLGRPRSAHMAASAITELVERGEAR